MNKSIKTSTAADQFGQGRARYFRSLAVVAFIAICSDAGLAQDTISKSLPQQSDTAATRQRRTSSESDDAVITFDAKKEVPRKAGLRVFVRSSSLLVRGAVVEEKLLKQPQFQQLGFLITRELSEADLILELRHDLFTMYVFTVVDAKAGLVLAGGKLSSLGGTVADKVAKRFVKKMVQSPGP
jgi:hypothetical protein